jgi:hypothetical protein
MYQIYQHLEEEFDCYFSQYFGESWNIRLWDKLGWLDSTILAGEFKRKGDLFIKEHGLKNDHKARVYNNQYDLVISCSDLIVPKVVRNTKSIWVQEGMTDPVSWKTHFVKTVGLAGYFTEDTSLNGTSNLMDIYCCASQGYKEHFAHWGTDPEKLVVTGMPNYDDADSLKHNDFPFSGYVMVATSDNRELGGKDDRKDFIQDCVKIANGRRLLFKLHPNEQVDRAMTEIRQWTPADTLIFHEGNTDHMIANCEELICQYSTVVYTGIALKKKVHSYFDLDELYSRAPIQNGGKSAAEIAQIARGYIAYEGAGSEFLLDYQKTQKQQDTSKVLA